MKSLRFALSFIVAASMASCGVTAHAQVAISASSVTDSFETPIPSAKLCFVPTNAAEIAAGFRVGSTQVIPNEVCGTVTAGALASGLHLAPSPSGRYYHVYLKQSFSNVILIDYGMTPITGSAWTLDTYDPATMSIPSSTLTVGTITLTAPGTPGSCTLAGAAPSFVLNCSLPGATGFQAVAVEHVFTGAGTFNYAHNIGYQYPLATCYVKSGATAYTLTPVDLNNEAVTVPAASDILCAFGYSLNPVAPAITANPVNWSGASSINFTFTAGASGYPPPTVQWQTDSGTSGATWTAVSGATSTTYSSAASSANGYEYRAVFTNTSGSATTTAATVTTANLTSGLVNYWAMNDGTGTTFVDSIAANNLTAGGITWSGGIPTFSGAGGVSGAYTTTQPAPLNNSTTPFTISAWVNLASTTGAYLLANTFEASSGYEFRIASSAFYLLIFSGGTPVTYVHGPITLLTAGVRGNLIATYDGSGTAAGIKLYINGTQLSTTVGADTMGGTPISAPSTNLFVMAEPDSAGVGQSQNNVPGTMDHLRIYNRVLNSTEIGLIQTGGN